MALLLVFGSVPMPCVVLGKFLLAMVPALRKTVFNSIGGIVSQATQEKRQQQPPNLVSLSSSGDQSHSTAGNDTTESCKTKILVRKTPAERCFLWLGGFRSSELLKLLANQLEPLTEQ
ncbi:hypothetical protein ZOSMA_132G00630 [Zostera marina]|uniref:DOG1 domain-containing protein n=1 Tax=Zostera marina TaxID=29655 RepID=A0A0K9PZ03_ZOSMR|nr:hypothetical protein ZOSMA_132G00630 [Zostera marina]